jgi:DNA repair photolyase
MSFKGWRKVIIKTDKGPINGIAPVIISASRVTDIPAFYSEWFMHRLRKGYVEWVNRFNGKSQHVSFEKTRAIIFWTKNAEPILKFLPELDRKVINYYFTFTLNDYEKEKLEPEVPPLEGRIETFKKLSDYIGKARTIWRFDPLILTDKISVDILLNKIYNIGKLIHKYTEKLVISFIDINLYRKVRNNLLKAGFIDCKEFTDEHMIRIAKGLKEMKNEWNIEIATCAEKVDLSEYGINHNKCIDDTLMIREFNQDKELMEFLNQGYLSETKNNKKKAFKDKGQRKYCGCIPSKDIGQYNTCKHRCIYCYAGSQ